MTPIDTVAEYYERIDAGDVDWIMNLFSDDAVYVRADSHYEGKSNIEHFFRSERKIHGRHEIESIDAADNRVFVRGEFTGQGAKGDARKVRFIDVWHFDTSGPIQLRETYLALGHQYVKD